MRGIFKTEMYKVKITEFKGSFYLKSFLSHFYLGLVSYLINRPGVAGAVLQTPPLLIDRLIRSLILCENIFKTPSVPNRER